MAAHLLQLQMQLFLFQLQFQYLYLCLFRFRIRFLAWVVSFDLLHGFSYIKFTLHTFGRPGSVSARRIRT